MQEPYQGEPYQDDVYYEPEPKKKMEGWVIALIIIAALIIVCCVCACLLYFLAAPSIGNVFSTVIEEMMTLTPAP
jgi:hypothetical protein